MNVSNLLQRQVRSPAFALAVTGLVAVVVAINATAFGALHALRWKALPYEHGEQLVELRANLQKFGFKVGLSDRLRVTLEQDHARFADLAGFIADGQTMSDESGRAWHVARTTPNIGRVLGVAPALGRGFTDEDAHPGADHVVLLSNNEWRSHFDADPAIVGQSVRLRGETYQVIGVMPPSFAFPDATINAWRPYAMSASEQAQADRGEVGDLGIIARLTPGTTIRDADATMTTLLASGGGVAGLVANAGLTFEARPWRERFGESAQQPLALLQLAALILLAAVGATLVNLQLDRLLGRAREFAVRRALGARGRDIALDIIADIAPPSLLGLALGLLAVPSCIALIVDRGLLPANPPQGVQFGPAAVVAGTLAALLAFCSSLFAAAIAQRANRLSSRAGTEGLGRVRPAMLVVQVMLTTALLGGAGLLLRSALNLISVDRGFDDRGVLITAIQRARATGTPVAVDERARWQTQVSALRDDLATLPGVQNVAIADTPPFTHMARVATVHVPGQDGDQTARVNGIGVGYFAALGIRISAGRAFENADEGDASPVIVDALYRQRYLASVDPLTATVGIADANGAIRRARIIGVVPSVKQNSLDEAGDLPTYYTFTPAPSPTVFLVTRMSGRPADLTEAVRQRVIAHLPDAGIVTNTPLSVLIAQTLADRETLLGAVGGFALVTLLLTGAGLALVLGFAVRRRQSELGVLMALGADPSGILRLVMRQGGRLIVLGATLGVLAGVPFARVLAEHLYGLAFTDPSTWIGSVLLVLVVAAFACWIPARSAARVSPTEALRHE
ncbi:MAG: ABC transporter permease [Dokdonella sp.]|uniref:ABC transporter permease n=1 Tax=Dokdonella sp. TaxID=2291710 RepID=UPI003264DE14